MNGLSEYLLENESFHRRTSNVRVQNGSSFYEYEIVIVAGLNQFPKSFRDPRAMRSVSKLRVSCLFAIKIARTLIIHEHVPFGPLSTA